MTEAEIELRQITKGRGIDSITTNLCVEGLSRMTKTRDPLHDDQHIHRIIKDLGIFLEQTKLDVNFGVLLIAICWHDIWKSTRFPTKLTTLLIDQYWDGYGSARIFKQAATKAGLDCATAHASIYAIREHGRLRLTKTKTLEARVLQDLDSLDEWSLTRIEPLKNQFLVNEPNPYSAWQSFTLTTS